MIKVSCNVYNHTSFALFIYKRCKSGKFQRTCSSKTYYALHKEYTLTKDNHLNILRKAKEFVKLNNINGIKKFDQLEPLFKVQVLT